MKEKIKVMVLGDHPFSPSGVGTQLKYISEALLDSEKFTLVSLGGAIKHNSYQPIKTDKYGDDWIIIPVDGYGTADIIRSAIRSYRPDILLFMSDPRFYDWLLNIENEVRACIPMVWYAIWDNYPVPYFNRPKYLSTDHMACISKLTKDIVEKVTPEVDSTYLPHAVNPDIFKPMSEEEKEAARAELFPEAIQEKVVFFWNNRNARRKQSGSVVWWFNEFLNEVGRDKATLIMHTDPKDPHGQDLEEIIRHLEMDETQILVSKDKVPPENLAKVYGASDCVINISDAEGWGLAVTEALSCAIPVIATNTGGMRDQITNGEEFFGVGIEPVSKAVIGSQQVPYIYEDRISKEDFIEALKKITNMKEEERRELGLRGRKHLDDNFSFSDFRKRWVKMMLEIFEKHGSWSDRKGYTSWELVEI